MVVRNPNENVCNLTLLLMFYNFKFSMSCRSMIFCKLVYRFPILLDAATAAVQRKGDKFLLNWAEIMTGKIMRFRSNFFIGLDKQNLSVKL